MQRPSLGHLEQPKRREADLFAMRRGYFAKPIMTSRYKGLRLVGAFGAWSR
jgi:hypothetical protein